MSWPGYLQLQYRHAPERPDADAARTVAHDRHEGPLRVLQALYPEGPAICHHVLVHPPGGIVGGDDLHIDVDVQPSAHALITTPGATRFYRSAGPLARQTARLRIGPGARLEWLPLETLLHDGCRARNALHLDLAEGSSMIGWDILALGLPASAQPMASGCFEQHIDWPARWLEQTRLDFEDPVQAALTHRLLASPLGWAARTVLATAWCAARPAWSSQTTEALTEAARDALSTTLPAQPPTATATATGGGAATGAATGAASAAPSASATPAQLLGAAAPTAGTRTAALAAPGAAPPLWGVTSPHPGLVVARVLAHRTEAVWPALQAVRAAWRQQLWSLPDVRPRVWRT